MSDKTKVIHPKDDTELVSAESKFGNPIKTYDDGYGPLWVYRNSMGVAGIVRAETFEKAYNIVLDEILVPIEQNEVPEAYGFYGENAKRALEIACEFHQELDLQEGYHYQPNSTGTGIVSTDLNGESLDPLTVEMLKHLEIKIKIKKSD